MPLIPYLASLLSTLLAALWAFLSVWVEELIIGFILGEIVSLIVQFIKDELLDPVVNWIKDKMDALSNETKELINTLFDELIDLVDSLNKFVCERFKLDIQPLIDELNVKIDEKVFYFRDLIKDKVSDVSTPINLLFDDALEVSSKLKTDLIELFDNIINPIILTIDDLIITMNTGLNDANNIINTELDSLIINTGTDLDSTVNSKIESAKTHISNEIETKLNFTNNLTDIKTTIQTKQTEINNKIEESFTTVDNKINELKSLFNEKVELINQHIDSNADTVLSECHSFVDSIANNKAVVFVEQFCNQSGVVVQEIKDGVNLQRNNFLEYADTLNEFTKDSISELENAMIIKAVEDKIKPHVEKISDKAKGKLDSDGQTFINSEFSDLFPINATITEYNSILDEHYEEHREEAYK